MIQMVTEKGLLTTQGEEAWQRISDEKKVELYQGMCLARQFDRRSINLQRQGRIGTYPPIEGQEAAQIGSASALDKQDWIFPSYRESGVAINVGMPISQLFLYWMGRVEGCKPPEGSRLMPASVPIATQMLHAVGTAWASKKKKDPDVSIAYFGDGATSEGDFHEALNFAGVFQVPVIFFCQNNGYAISVPFSRQSASTTVSARGSAYNIPSIQVDGNDVLAVYSITSEAIERARAGKGPTLIEAVTYRKGSHTTADDATRYRPKDEALSWIHEKDPIIRWRTLLLNHGLWTGQQESDWLATCDHLIEEGIKVAELTPAPSATHLFEHIYHEPTSKLLLQREECEKGGISWRN